MQKHSFKFWLFFWLISVTFLLGWFLFWSTKNKSVDSTVATILKILPFEKKQKNDFQALAVIGNYFFQRGDQVKTLLVLFQNNMEIRPGGGFIGSFGILKIKNGKLLSFETHDVSSLDSLIPDVEKAPEPISEIMHTNYWKLRDSNFSPDFEENAKKAMQLYTLAKGGENFDGVIGVTSDVLGSLLKITGPVAIDGYPGTYDSENAILALEYQVEKAFQEQGIQRAARKSIMGDFAKIIEKKIFELSITDKIKLAKILLRDLEQKDIQLQFNDSATQKAVQAANWSGKVDSSWNNDYLMLSDANLGAFKSDYYIKRSLDYTVDFSQKITKVKVKILYDHTANQKDWMTRDYLTYLRIYVPEGSQFENSQNFDNQKSCNDFGKACFAAIIRVPLATNKTVEVNYSLPQRISEDNYKLLLQKQAGINNLTASINIIHKDGSKRHHQYNLNSDLIVE